MFNFFGLNKNNKINHSKGFASQAGTYEPKDLNRIKGATTYNNYFYGIYNMGDNVKEWLIDEYSPVKKQYQNQDDIFTENGFVIPEPGLLLDADGVIREKDSLGRMPYRVMGVKNNGDDMRMLRYLYRNAEGYIAKKINPDSLKIKEIQRQKIKEKFAKFGTVKIYASNDYGNTMNQLAKKGYYVYANLGFYRSEYVEEKGHKMQVFVLDTLKLLNSPENVAERMFTSYSRTNPASRVVKSGTWRNASTTARESMKETDASADVGFRLVIPYLGMPLEKKYMVKWK
jgi:hypothetical protein